MKRMKRWFKRIWILSATLLVLFAISLTVFRALTPWAAQYKGALEKHLSTALGTSVSIHEMKTSWYWFEPVLKLDGVRIAQKDASVLNINELLVGIDLMRSFLHWRIQPGILFVEDATFNFRENNLDWQLDGVVLNHNIKAVADAGYSTALDWLLAHQKIVMRRVGATLHWKDGRVTVLKPMNLEAQNHNGHYRVQGTARLDTSKPSVLTLLADLRIPTGFSSNVKGQVYLSIAQLHFAEWHTFFETLGFEVLDGQGALQLWLDLKNAHVVSAQSHLRVDDVVWQRSMDKAPRNITHLDANMAWRATPEGWVWEADHVKFRANHVTWPENAFAVHYDAKDAAYRVYAKTLLLAPMRDVLREPLPALKPLFDMQVQGALHDAQFGLQAGKINYMLARFSDLSWQAYDQIPGIAHVSGALSWEPTEGHLALNSKQMVLKPKNKPVLDFEWVNASVLWKSLSDGWRVNVDRSVFQHAHGVFSAEGVLDNVSRDLSHTRLAGDLKFALHDATFWKSYLPEQGLKPKLKAWFEQDVTRVQQLSGKAHVQGALSDFPFDKPSGKTQGEFLVTGAMAGVDLRFNPAWSLVRDITGTFQLDKRLLTLDIDAADFDNIPMEQGKVTVRNLGLNHEVLVAKGIARAPLDVMQDYIKHSPLHKRLSKLDALAFKAPGQLDLEIQFPFYAEPVLADQFKVRGLLDFKENDLLIKEVSETVGLHDLSGELSFDERGVVDSKLGARLFDEPMALWVRAYHGDSPYLAIDMTGYLSALGLRNTLKLPALAAVRGRTPIKSVLKITDENRDLDTLQITSTLKGLALDLPAPLGKQRDETVPFAMDMQFNLKQGIRLKLDYQKKMSTDLWFDGPSSTLQLARGEVVLGGGQAVLRDKPGASIVGQFDTLDWPAWSRFFKTFDLKPAASSADVLKGFQSIHLSFDEADILQQNYKYLSLYAQRMPTHVWSVVMKTADVSADLKYEPVQKDLSGNISAWRLNLPDKTAPVAEKPLDIKPHQIPRLKLKVGALQVGDVNAGRLFLKGAPGEDNAWHLETGKLTSDAYMLKTSGVWQDTPKPETQIDATLKIDHLEKALVHWDITPAVESNEGELQLSGAWHGAPQDFSVKALTGQLKVLFKEGRIPNLSPETEKKMALGKILSILSLQTIPRRLKLDFSDLAKPGYSFDKFDGHFVLAHGIMQTEDSEINGPVARATIKGSLNLDKHLYDVSLHVMPHITASLPVVATIAGGPVAGIATWVASKLINQGMDKISGYTYDVSGPWDEPVVQQVHIYKKIIQPNEQVN